MKNIWIWLVVAVVIIGGGYWLWQSQQAPAAVPVGTGASSQVPVTSDTGTSAPMSATVTYDGKSFSPSSVTIKQGGTVTFTSTSGSMWVASNPHPAHTGYDGTSQEQHCKPGYAGAAPFDQCISGTTFSFTFDKAGTWGYHDHMNHGVTGTVIVQ